MKTLKSIGALSAALLLSGCMAGPDYQRPTLTLPAHYKEARGWQQATPQDDRSKGEWWRVYHDATLSALLRQVTLSNQNVANYAAQYREAQALVAQSRAALFPSLSADVSATRSGSRASTTGQRSVSHSDSAGLSASWEPDLWGKLRRTAQQNQASAQASRAELANITLSAQAALAQAYFQLRIFDKKIALYQRSIAAYQRYLRVIANQYAAGSESRATVAQAQMQLESARASAEDYQWQRAQTEHAIALLLGRAPADFSLPVAPLRATLPDLPVGLPATLLQRRPDIAYAERNVAAASAATGVALAAYYPDITLSASGGVSASALSQLFSLPSRVWSLGPALSGTLLDFGATAAKVTQARAAYDASVASYRQTVLTALGEVEDDLAELNTLQGEIAAQQRAAAAAQASARVTRNQYDAGMIDYLDVATTENSSLSEQQSLLSLQSTQWVSSVALIAALGGGWQAESEDASGRF